MAKKTKTAKVARRKKIVAVAMRVFGKLAEGLVKVWHKNHSFIISKEDAINLTLEQLEQLVKQKDALSGTKSPPEESK